jgi:hypothetical protein
MPGFNAQAILAKVRTGNAVAILVGDTPVGFGQTSSHSLSFGTESFYGIGSKKPTEIQQLKYAPTITLSSLQLTDVGLKYFGYSSTWLEVLVNTELNISVADSKGNVLVMFVGCTAGSYSSNISANVPISEEVSFEALDILDPNGVSLLNDGTDALLVNVVGAVVGAVASIV